MTNEEFLKYAQFSFENYLAETSRSSGKSIEEVRSSSSGAPTTRTPKNLWFLAKLDQKEIGYLWVEIKDDMSAFGWDIYLSEEYRSKGFGRQLMRSMRNKLRAANVHSVQICVVEGNLVARKLYESLGFKEIAFNEAHKRYTLETRIKTLEIEEINPDELTKQSKDALVAFTNEYDLEPFFYTTKIQINSDGSSQSHPILTLSTKSAHYPDRLLSTFLHEQFHWWASEANDDDFRLAMQDLKDLFPILPEMGVAGSVFSTYLHLIICWKEFQALNSVIGEARAKSVLESFIHEAKIYEWIYTQVLMKYNEIELILHKRNLL